MKLLSPTKTISCIQCVLKNLNMDEVNLKNLDNESHAGSLDDAINMQNVKKKFRPDWMDDENKIFINRLNKICENYENNNLLLNKLKDSVFKT